MTRSGPMAPHAPHSATAASLPHGRKLASRPAPAATPHRRPHPAHAAGHGGLVTLALVGAAALGAGLWWMLGGDGPAADPGAQLLAQMEAAAQGNVVPTHAFGGALSVTQANGRTNVVAEDVPSRACVQVGWRLAKGGTIVVNGTLPQRLSAAKLSDLCSGDAATLLWVPDQ